MFNSGYTGHEVAIVHLDGAAAAAAKLLQSCPTLCSPTDGSPPGSPIAGILQARTLEWVAQVEFLTTGPPGRPWDNS